MPSEPAESNFKTKIKGAAYPCVERGGLIWTYMGPRETPPPLPDLEPNMVMDNVRAMGQECNWLQSMENNMDTVHVPFLHFGAFSPDSLDDTRAAELEHMFPNEQIPNNIRFPAPNFMVKLMDFGGSSAAQRPSDKDQGSYYYRMMNWLFPFYTQHPGGKMEDGCQFVAVVPVDDTYTISYGMSMRQRLNIPARALPGVIPNTTDWHGRFRPELTVEMDMNIDRDLQKNGKNTLGGYTGIESVGGQDQGITDSQGVIQDRSIEHLGTTDRMIILARRRLLEAARALRDRGAVPPGVDDPSIYRQRSGSFYAPKNVDPWEFTKEVREVFKREQPIAPVARA
jgi:phenylpropionate dioxygenase-like ring-hydroxylating dioxygenase large terminal subunit